MRKHLANVLGIILSISTGLFLQVLAIWQLDLIMVHPVWDWVWSTTTQYASWPWECWFWHSTVGEAYNTLLAFILIGFFIAVLGVFISVWKWTDN